jgi:hypothetical protein
MSLALNPGYTQIMTISPTAVRFDDNTLWVDLSDGRTIGVPLSWFPRLMTATLAQREGVELSRTGLHWKEIDEDISVAGLFAGRDDMTKRTERFKSIFRSIRISDYIALTTVTITVATLYVSQLRQTSQLSVALTELNVQHGSLQQKADGTYLDLQTHIGLVLINSGNTTATLLRVFWIIPDVADYDCRLVSKRMETRWEILGAHGYHDTLVRYQPFNFGPQIIAPYSSVFVKGSTETKTFGRSNANLGTPRQMCVAFVSVDSAKLMHYAAVPTIRFSVYSDSTGYSIDEQIKKIFTLIDYTIR